MKQAIRLTLACSALLLSYASSARDIYVDAGSSSANDSNAGTATAPLRSLSAGVAAAMPGDTVIVKPGRYSDPNANWYSAFTPARSGTASAPITIKAVPALGATLVPRDFTTTGVNKLPALSIYRQKYIIVDGFKAEGMLKIHNDVDPAVPQYVTIQNCDVLYGSQLGEDPSLNWGIALHVTANNVLRNNTVRQMRNSGNTDANTAAIMNFASTNNVIENNDADAGSNVFAAYGQKAGKIHNNVWRYNIARNGTAGFLGKGGTDGASYSDDETFYGNIIIGSERAFHLNHNSRRWKVYNNTAYNVKYFFNQWQLSSTGNQFWNNLVANSSGGVYQIEDLGSPTWSSYISGSNHNFFGTVPSTFARWQYGSQNYSLAQWRSNTGYDANSLTGDPLFVNAAGGDFKLQASSPARGKGRNGENIGAYVTGSEVVGVNRGPRPSPPEQLTVQ